MLGWPHVPIRCGRANLLPGPPLSILSVANGCDLDAQGSVMDWNSDDYTYR